MDFLKKVGAFLKLHWVTVFALLTVLWSIDKPYVDAFVKAHASAAIIYANIAAVVAFYLKSPRQ